VTSDPDYPVHVVNNTLLVLHNALQSHTGNYTCHVTNMAATRARTVSIVVSSKSLKQLLLALVIGGSEACVIIAAMLSNWQYVNSEHTLVVWDGRPRKIFPTHGSEACQIGRYMSNVVIHGS